MPFMIYGPLGQILKWVERFETFNGRGHTVGHEDLVLKRKVGTRDSDLHLMAHNANPS